MFPSTNPPYRYLRALQRSRTVRLAATGMVLVLPLACSDQDADVFGAGDSAPVESLEPDGTPTSTTEGAAADVSTTAAAAGDVSTTEAVASEGTADVPSGDPTTVPASTEMVVEFTYAPSSSQRAHNPYVAVWIEDLDGNLVQTVSLWFEQSSKGAKWLRDLSSWYSTSGGDAITSGATRAAGTYSVAWDGTGLDGQLVPLGEYVLYVEAAREHGPHSITSASLTVDGSAVSVSLPDDGELSGASVTLIA